jgi:uncharacterized protein (TIGR03437 family)
VNVIHAAKFLLILSCAALWPASAQTPTWDNSGNSMLKGTYYFRHVYYFLDGNHLNGTLADAATVYGNITFNGGTPGTYSMTLTLVEAAASGQPQRGTTSGTYSISASGYGFISNPLFTGGITGTVTVPGDLIYGLVNAQGIFVGGDTENANGYNDLFVAAPVGNTLAGASTFKGSYSVAFMDLSSGNPVYTLNAMLSMNPDGAGNLGTVGLSGYIGGAAAKATQSLTGGRYIFTNGAGVINLPPSNTAYLQGQYYVYISPDGNFVFGGSPFSYDMFVGVRTATAAPSLNGLYYQAGIDQDVSTLSSGYALLDSYFGAVKAGAGAVVGQQRLLELLSTGVPVDYTYTENYSVKSDGTYSTPAMNYVVGAGGIRVGAGIGPSLGINVALPAPTFTGTGVFLDPTGVVNAASSAPFTAGIAPGELLTLYGTNLAAALTIAPGTPFTTSLGGVQVTVNGLAAPLYYVSQTQISAIVPYGITGSIAQVQVNNNGTLSNAVSMFTNTTAPGIFTVPPGGLGYGAILHQDGNLVTNRNPAQIGETVSVFVTGLGAVTPTIADGAAGPAGVLSFTTNTITAYVGATKATVTFSGLAPQLAGLYQVNVTIPSGVTAGDNFLGLAGPDAYTAEVLIPIAGTAAATAAPLRAAKVRASPQSPLPLPPAGARPVSSRRE